MQLAATIFQKLCVNTAHKLVSRCHQTSNEWRMGVVFEV